MVPCIFFRKTQFSSFLNQMVITPDITLTTVDFGSGVMSGTRTPIFQKLHIW